MVEEFINTTDHPGDEIEKRKPKPFRYISDPHEIYDLLDQELSEKTIMSDEETTAEKLRKNFETTLGVGDVDSVEMVLQKHISKRKIDRDRDIA